MSITFLNESKLIFCIRLKFLLSIAKFYQYFNLGTQLKSFKHCYLTLIIIYKIIFWLHTVKCFQVLLCIINNSIGQSFIYTVKCPKILIFNNLIEHSSFVRTQFRWLNSTIWIRRQEFTTPGQSRPASNGNERILHFPQSSSLTIRLLGIISRTLNGERVINFCCDAVGRFYRLTRQCYAIKVWLSSQWTDFQI